MAFLEVKNESDLEFCEKPGPKSGGNTHGTTDDLEYLVPKEKILNFVFIRVHSWFLF